MDALKHDNAPYNVLDVSLRNRSYSRLATETAARLLRFLGAETRISHPSDLPQPDQVSGDDHPAVHGMRAHALWSEGQVLMRPRSGAARSPGS